MPPLCETEENTLMPRRILLFLLFAATPLAAQTLRVPFDSFTLANGLQVLVAPDHAVPVVTVNIWYHVGSGDEKPGRTGFAHLFEHIMFMGSQHVPTGDFDKRLEAAGGDNNGSTTQDRTHHFEGAASDAPRPTRWRPAARQWGGERAVEWPRGTILRGTLATRG